jgi:hypothetical protein
LIVRKKKQSVSLLREAVRKCPSRDSMVKRWGEVGFATDAVNEWEAGGGYSARETCIKRGDRTCVQERGRLQICRWETTSRD